MVLSTNQFRHLYVAKAKVDSVATLGDIAVKTDKDGSLYFQYQGHGGPVRSDLIDPKTIMYAKATSAEAMATKLKGFIVTLDSEVNEGEPIVGQDYILKLAFRQFVGVSDGDAYLKYGMVHAYKGMNAAKFYATLAISLAKNFSRELTKMVKISLLTGAAEPDGFNIAKEDVQPTDKIESLTGNYTGILIDEVSQASEWVRGTRALTPVNFEVFGNTVTLEGSELNWAKVEEDDSQKETIPNGYTLADMEYFYMGERGDIYRIYGQPNAIPTKYMIEDPTKSYHALDIHYAYVGPNEAVQKSEKDITIVCENKTVLNSIITAVNSAANITIASL
jgi:hypothetical protein